MRRLPVCLAYTDGSVLTGAPERSTGMGPGGWAAVVTHYHNRPARQETFYLAGSATLTTNIRMELVAVLRVIQHVNHPATISICTDSQYVLDGFKRLSEYKFLRTHLDLWGLLLLYTTKYNITINKVKAHSGDQLNELADSIARDAAKRQVPDTLISDLETMRSYADAID